MNRLKGEGVTRLKGEEWVAGFEKWEIKINKYDEEERNNKGLSLMQFQVFLFFFHFYCLVFFFYGEAVSGPFFPISFYP